MSTRSNRLLTWSILVAALLLGALLVFLFIHRRGDAGSRDVGTAKDLAPYVEKLLKTKPDDAALIIVTIQRTGDFVQLTVSDKGARLHVPVATDRQKQVALAVREAMNKAGCELEEMPAGEVIFLEAELGTDGSAVARKVVAILRDGFASGDETPLVFDHAGLE